MFPVILLIAIPMIEVFRAIFHFLNPLCLRYTIISSPGIASASLIYGMVIEMMSAENIKKRSIIGRTSEEMSKIQ